MLKSFAIITLLQVFALACETDLKMTVVQRPALSEEYCLSNPGKYNCPDFMDSVRKDKAFKLEHIGPNNSVEGQVVRLKGASFDEHLLVTIEGQDVPLVKISDTEALFFTPSLASPGLKTGVLKRLERSIEFKLFILADKTINPASITDATGLCEGTEFMAADGSIALGSKACANTVSGVNCSEDGEVGCITTDSFTAADIKSAASKILAGERIGGVAGNVALPAASKVLSGEVFGAAGQALSGTLTLPSPASVRATFGPYGVGGSGSSPALADCSSNGGTGCVTTAGYQSADLTNLLAGNIRRGVSIGGTTGNFPSSASPLPRYSDTGATSNTSGSDITDLTSFITQLTSDGAFEYWSSTGLRGTGSGDSDLVATNIKNAVALENFSITGNHVGAGNCTADGQIGCTTTSRYKSMDTDASVISTWDIRGGKSAGGINGSIEFYKNMANTTLFNRITGTGSAAGLDIYDTMDDFNNDGAFPTQNNTGWAQATGANWAEVVASTVYRDNITGLVWLRDQGSAFTWEDAISQCEASTAGSRSDWRLPTQKELMQAYTDGIWSQRTNLSLLYNDYWSASSVSENTPYAWIIIPFYGYTYYSHKGGTDRVVCVAP